MFGLILLCFIANCIFPVSALCDLVSPNRCILDPVLS